MDNSESDSCLLCKGVFSLTIRRHHCRVCYRLVCGACSDHSVELDGDGLQHRVCRQCFVKLGREGLVGHSFSCGKQHETCFHISINAAEYFAPPFPQSLAHDSVAARNLTNDPAFFVVLFIGDQVVKTTECVLSRTPVWSESVMVRANLSSILENHIILELRDKSRKINGEEFVGRCRVNLIEVAESSQQSAWYTLRYKNYRCWWRVHLSLRRDPAPTRTPRPPMLDISIPCAVPFAELFGTHRRGVIPLVHVFPPSSRVHRMLFTPLYPTDSASTSPASPCMSPSNSPGRTHRNPIVSPGAFIPCNEMLLEGLENVWMRMCSGGVFSRGVLLLTSHRLVFIQYPSSRTHSPSVILWVPHAHVQSVSIRRRWMEYFHTLVVLGRDQIGYLFICSRDKNELRTIEAFRYIKSEISWRREQDTFSAAIDTLVMSKQYSRSAPNSTVLSSLPDMDPSKLPFVPVQQHDDTPQENSSSLSSDLNNAVLELSGVARDIATPFQIYMEYDRIGINEYPQWRRTLVNRDYTLCPTYPAEIVVPSAISDRHLRVAATQRSAQRLPVLSWIHPLNGASLCRSSQPLVGITTAACPEDERLLMTIRTCAISAEDDAWLCEDGDAWQCEDVSVSEEDKNVMSSQELPWTEVVSVKPRQIDRGVSESAVMSIHGTGGRDKKDINVPHVVSADDINLLIGMNKDIGSEMPSPTDAGSKRKSNRSAAVDQKRGEHGDEIRRKPTIERIEEDACDINDGENSERSAKSSISVPDTKNSIRCNNAPANEEMGRRLRIIDARPLINAKGNALMGKGHEIIGRLGGESCTTLEFAGIANIHVMRDSLSSLRRACCSSGASTTWLSQLQESQWLQHISLVLRASLRAALHLDSGDPVLVHCSDGWDRTSQMVALAQLMLDPYYRTISGLKALICKDFNAFGHMFHHRSGLVDSKEGSPVFVQFLDAVWQIWRQMPWEFEYKENLLLLLFSACNTRFTSDFLHDNEKEKIEYEHMLRGVIQKEICRTCRVQRKNQGKSESNIYLSRSESPRSADDTFDSEVASGTWKSTEGVREECRSQTPDGVRDTFHSEESPRHSSKSSRRQCAECERLLSNCMVSIWTYVAHHLEEYTNPLYNPSTSEDDDGFHARGGTTSKPSRAPAKPNVCTYDDSALCTGGVYYSHTCSDGPMDDLDNIAYEEDLGLANDDQCDPFILDFDPFSSRPCTSDHISDTEAGTSIPRQLFVPHVLAQHAPLDTSIRRSDSLSMHDHCEIAPSPVCGVLPSSETKRSVYLLTPSIDIQCLALWESAHYSGIPKARTFASASNAYTRGLEAMLSEMCNKNKALEETIEKQDCEIRKLHQQLHADDEEYVMFPSGVNSRDDSGECRIISTGTLIEDYMWPKQR